MLTGGLGPVEAEYAKDTWDAFTLGIAARRGANIVGFGAITQVWVREAVKQWSRFRLLGIVWVFAGREAPQSKPSPIEDAIPQELLDHDIVFGGNIEVRTGGWRLAPKTGTTKVMRNILHRTSLWRMFKVMRVGH